MPGANGSLTVSVTTLIVDLGVISVNRVTKLQQMPEFSLLPFGEMCPTSDGHRLPSKGKHDFPDATLNSNLLITIR